MDPELDAARAGVAPFLLVPRADVAEQPSGQRAMNGAVAFGALGINGGFGPVELAQRARELRRDVAPLAHARDGEKVLATRLFHLVLEELRQVEKGEEIGALMREARVALVGGRRLVERAFAR